MRCPVCKEEESMFELNGTKACEDCWHEWWEDEGIGENESWMEFKEQLNKVKEKK
jgi:hypothetical protein